MILLLAACSRPTPTPAPPPQVLVEVAWDGVDAASMEQLVAQPVEAAVVGLIRVDHVQTVSTPGLVQVTVAMEPQVEPFDALSQLTLRLDGADLPEGAQVPTLRLVQQEDTGDVVVELGANTPEGLIQAFDTVSNRLHACPAVTGTSPTLRLEPTVRIEVDRERAAVLGLSVTQIASSAAGIDDPALLEAMTVTSPGGEVIPLTAVASIHLEQAPVHLGRVNSRPATWFHLSATDVEGVQDCVENWQLPRETWVKVY